MPWPAEPPDHSDRRGAGEPEDGERAQRAQHRPEGEPPIGRGGDDESGQQQGRRHLGEDEAQADGASDRRAGVAEQQRRRHRAGSRQRSEREGEGGEGAGGGGDGQRQRVETEPCRHRQLHWQQLPDHERGKATDHQPDRDAERRQDGDLQEVDGDDQASGRADGFEDGDRERAAHEITADRVADPDTAHQQRGQSHQRQEQPHAVQQVLQHRRGIGAVADPPAGIGKALPEGRYPSRHVRAGGKRHPVAVVEKRAGHHEAGLGERRLRDHQARTQDEYAGRRVRFVGERRAQHEAGIAHAQDVAGLDAEAIEQRRRRHRAPEPVRLGERRRRVRWADPASPRPRADRRYRPP